MAKWLLKLLLVLGVFPGLLAYAASSQDVSFKTADGVELNGCIFGKGKNAVILSHMKPDTQKNWQSFAEKLAEKGYMAFTYDFRGYGKSSGKKGYSKLDVDLLAALDFVRKRKPNRIVLIGGSMGAMASAKVAASQSVDGVVIMSGYYGSTTFVGPTEDDIKAIKAPLLFITSEEDSSYANMRSMYKLATSEKAERIFPGSGHGRAICYGQYASDCQQLIFDFLDEVAPLK